MARVGVEQTALSDARFSTLGRLLGTNRHEALGRMVLVWNECQERETYLLSGMILDGIFERDNAGELLAKAELVRPQGDSYYICGTKGRIEWLSERRKDGRKGGRPKTIGLTTGIDGKLPADNPPTLTPAPTPALSPTQTPEKGISRLRRSVDVPQEGFLKAWSHYPHYKQRSSKAKSAETWKKHKLETQVESVLSWIEALKGDEATREGGQFVPAMERWLAKHDFTDSPPTGSAAGTFYGYDEAEIERLLES